MSKTKALACIVACLTLAGCAASDTSEPSIGTVKLPQQESSMLYGELMTDIGSMIATEDEEAEKDLESWKSINSDVCALLRIPDLEIYEPVVAAREDNKQWLRTNIYGEKDIKGCIFLDSRCDLGLTPIKLIHGHNMKDGSMFANLPKLLELESCKDAPVIQLYAGSGWLDYEVFSIMSVDSTKEALPIDFLVTEEDIEKIAEELLERSVVPEGVYHTGDLIILNTCWYGRTGTEHNLHCLVVASRK